MSQADVTIIGAGLAGLTCARVLHSAGIHFHILEATDQIGGRVKTYHQKGFLLDHGFQVYLTAYDEPKRWIDVQSINLQKFLPGTLIRVGNSFHRLMDPFRAPFSALQTLLSPIGTVSDKIRIGRLKAKLQQLTEQQIFFNPSISTLQYLQNEGFSNTIIQTFFRPFFGGVFLENELKTNSQFFEYVFKMFSASDIGVPEMGMGSIVSKLAEPLPFEQIRLNSKVVDIDGTVIQLTNGEKWKSKAVVVATDILNAAILLKQDTKSVRTTSSTNLYFAAKEPPIEDPILMLNGTGSGVINNVAVMSQVSQHYANSGEALISVTVIGSKYTDKEVLKNQVRSELQEWFGKQVNVWRSLPILTIENAHPLQLPVKSPIKFMPQEIKDNVIVCGDFCNISTINGAMVSGRQAGELLLHRLGVQSNEN